MKDQCTVKCLWLILRTVRGRTTSLNSRHAGTSESGVLGVSAKSMLSSPLPERSCPRAEIEPSSVTHGADERGSRYKLPGPGGPERVPKPNWVAYVLMFLASIICRLCKLTLSDQDHVTLQLTVILSDLVSKFVASPPMLNPLSAALVTQNVMFVSW